MHPQQFDESGFDTRTIHAGRAEDVSSMPIYMASTSKNFYTRGGNPTIDAMEECITALEGGTGAVAAACGMSTVTQTLLTLLKSGDRLICHRSIYDWADTFVLEELPRFGIETLQVDLRDPQALKSALEKPTRIVYFEPLSNPGLDMVDVKQVISLAHTAGALAVVDNTFLSPALLRPLELGADAVIHSLTKYLCGHSDAMGGIVVSKNSELIEKLRRGRNIYGGVISPFNAFLILRGISTLQVRMRQHCANAQKVAEFLAGHPLVAETRYPGLLSDPGHLTATKLLSEFGGMVGFVLAGGQKAGDVFSASLKMCKAWVSLGAVETLIYPRWPEARKGIPEGYMRMSVGLETADDIIRDLDQALDKTR